MIGNSLSLSLLWLKCFKPSGTNLNSFPRQVLTETTPFKKGSDTLIVWTLYYSFIVLITTVITTFFFPSRQGAQIIGNLSQRKTRQGWESDFTPVDIDSYSNLLFVLPCGYMQPRTMEPVFEMNGH